MKGSKKSSPPRWRWWREADARQALAELEASGMSLDAFARSRGVSPSRLRHWKRRLGTEAPVRFVPVAGTAASAAVIEVEVRGVVLRVREDLDAQHLCRLVTALAGRLPPC